MTISSEDPRAPGYSAAVAAALANDGRRFARDGRFVHAGNAFDDIAIGGNRLARAQTTRSPLRKSVALIS